MKNNVQQLRESRHLTQTELAEKSGLSLRTIQRVEAGNNPKGYTLKALAEALEVEPEEVFNGNNQDAEVNRIKFINISALSFLILPFGNLIIPAVLTYKSTSEKTKSLGKSILDIQIIWTLITMLLMIVSPFVQKSLAIEFPLFLLFLLSLICINIYIILKNGKSISQNQKLSIRLKYNIL